MHRVKWYHTVGLLVIILLVLLNYLLPKNHTKQLVAIQAYQSFSKDSFTMQHQILDLNVNNIPTKNLPAIDAKFCTEQFGIPTYYPVTTLDSSTYLPTITYQSDTNLPKEMRTTFTETYTPNRLLASYDINGQQILYNATYNYTVDNQISLITEQQGAVTFTYDTNKLIQTVQQLNKDFKPVKKIYINYIYLE
jgi:hypothetical protein